MNYSPWMTPYIIEKGLLANDPLCLVDVGASGGVDSCWKAFGKYFKAFGFEPLIAECERLNADINKPKNVNYFPYLVGSDDDEVRAESGHGYSCRIFERTSAAKVDRLKKMKYIQEYFNSGKEIVYTDQKISIDQFFANHPVDSVDFIKIDTDGYDYEVLQGAQRTLNNKQVLGITIESQFHGKPHHHSNTFRNIDRLLTDNGFSLFDLEVYRYTKQDLPGNFVYNLPAQTTTGRAMCGEAVYFRDYALGKQDVSSVILLKLACLFEVFNLPDCSAELLNIYKKQLSSLVDVQKCLDFLVKDIGKECSYQEHIKRFEDNFEDFYPPKPPDLKKKNSYFSKFFKKD